MVLIQKIPTVHSDRSVNLNGATFYLKPAAFSEVPFACDFRLSLLFLINAIVLPWLLAGHMMGWETRHSSPRKQN